jgi:hypothetical protein
MHRSRGGTGSSLLLVVLLVALGATPGSAQLAPPQPMDSIALTRALGELRAGQPIRVALLNARWVGNFERVAGDTLYFGSPNDRAMAIRFNAIDSLWRRESAGSRGSRMGGLTLGILFAAAGAIWVADEGGGAGRAIGGAVLGGVLGATAGSVVGGWVGSASRVWRRLYPE